MINLGCLFPDWPAPENIQALSTMRHGGTSLPPYDSLNLAVHVGDELDSVMANRRLLYEKLALPAEPVWLDQTHSTIVVEANIVSDTPTADASWSEQVNMVCAVLSADCLPLLVCNKAGTLVSAIHAGWRGLAAGVIEAAIHALPANPADLLVWLGPAIGQQAFEVGADVLTAFTEQDPSSSSAFERVDSTHWHASLYELAKIRLTKLGITQIYGGNHCTYTEKNRFYSFRREGKTGRIATLIWRES